MAFSDLDTHKMTTDMISAAAIALGAGWDQVKSFVKVEFRTLASRIKEIGKAVAVGDIDQVTAKLLMRMQINNASAAIAAVTTLVLVTVENMINAALNVIRTAVNTALGFSLV